MMQLKNYEDLDFTDDFLFGKGRSVYTFENRCLEMPELAMGEGAKVIFFNADGDTDDISEDLRNFLHYMKNHEPKDAFTKDLQDAVEQIVRMGRKFGMFDKDIMEDLMNVCHMSEENAKDYLKSVTLNSSIVKQIA